MGYGRWDTGCRLEIATGDHRKAIERQKEEKKRKQEAHEARINSPAYKLLERIQSELEHNREQYEKLPIGNIHAACLQLGIDVTV